MDFVSDCTAGGRTIRALTLVDDYTRGCLAIEARWAVCGYAGCWRQCYSNAASQKRSWWTTPEFHGCALTGWSEERCVRPQIYRARKTVAELLQ